ncbi:MAG: PEP-CTERM sorting domain-containing protein [Pirellulales bacterium]|nr:PEP-CTERM sorting domain-containing protein [Pirellulales bacterium]
MRNTITTRDVHARLLTAVRGRLVLAALPVLILFFGGRPAMAVDLVMTFNSGSSAAPSYDSDGSKLTALMSAVETYYEDIFEASGTLNVEFYYQNIDVLAVHNNLATSGGKPTSCRIRVDTNRTWYFDETPFDNSEYNMSQMLARDLTSTEISDYYNGTPNDFLEVSYMGGADWGSAPWDCIIGYDLFGLLLHEMGHGLGMTGNVAYGEVSSDNDYDFDPDLMWGGSAAAECYASDNRYHLDVETTMYPYSTWGERRLPSATDILSIETTCNWGDTTIDLKRQDFYSASANADFNDPGNWAGNKVPDSADDVWVRHGNDATLSADIRVNYLAINEGVTVFTGANRLYADRDCTLGNGSNYARVYVNNGGEFQVDLTLTVANNAEVQMDAGSLLDVDSLSINVGGAILGAGTIDIEDGLINCGRITVSGGDLAIDSDVNVNLDGNSPNDGAGEVYVTGGNFSCNKPLTDNFTGYIRVNGGYTATFTEGWRINTGGTLFLNGGTTNETRAAVDGGLFKIAGAVNVNNRSRILCDSEFQAGAVVTLTDTADNLFVHGESVIMAGATFTGSGRIYSNALMTIEDGASIGVRLTNNSQLTIEEGGVGSVTIGGTFEMRPDDYLFLEANGDESCDYIDVNANAILDGILSLSFIGGYSPEVGDSFTVMTFNSRSGTFDSIVWNDPSVTLSANYSSTSLVLTVTPGDGLTAVPEPGTLAMLLGGLVGLCLVYHRRNG